MSRIRFVMHPDDESTFAGRVLASGDIVLIDGPRWKKQRPEKYRDLEGLGHYCIICPEADVPLLKSCYNARFDDWYCESEGHTLQFLRSKINGNILTEGSLAVSVPRGATGAPDLERRYRELSGFIRKNYKNRTLHWINPCAPVLPASAGRSANPGRPDAQLWVGPAALRWLEGECGRCVKFTAASRVEAVLCNS